MLDTEPSGAGLSGTISSATSTPQALPAHQCRAVLINNDPASAVTVLVGFADSQLIPLAAGDSINIAAINSSLIYVKTASGTATVNWMVRK